MDAPVSQLLATLGQEDLDLLDAPAQPAVQQRDAEPVETRRKVLVRVGANLLVLGVLGPRVHGPLEMQLRDVDEPGLLHLPAVVLGRLDRMVESLAGLDRVLAQLQEGAVGRQRVVVGADGERDVRQLEPAARPEVAVTVGKYLRFVPVAPRKGRGLDLRERLPEELWPVGKRASEHPAVDEVERLGVGPVLLDVIDVKVHVRRDTVFC